MPKSTQNVAWSSAASAPEALEGKQRASPSGTVKESGDKNQTTHLLILLS